MTWDIGHCEMKVLFQVCFIVDLKWKRVQTKSLGSRKIDR